MAKKTSPAPNRPLETTPIMAELKTKQPLREVVNQGGMAPWLAIMVLLIFAGVFAVMRWGGFYLSENPTFNLLIGALIALVGQVGQYYFGSSLGSKQKTRLLEREMEGP